MKFARILRLNAVPPDIELEIGKSQSVIALIVPGPFVIQYGVAVHHHGPNFAGMTTDIEQRPFGKGCYLVLLHISDRPTWLPDRSELGLALSEVEAVIALRYPAMVGEVLYEGPIADQNQMAIFPVGPIHITSASPLVPEELKLIFDQELPALATALNQERGRFRLASRWYLRGKDALNPVDKFLFYYIALEVFPATGTINVPRAVSDFIRNRVYPTIELGDLKSRLSLGHIASRRADIVHNGLAFVEIPIDKEFDLLLRKLERIVQVCLRLLANIPHGGLLDEWVEVR